MTVVFFTTDTELSFMLHRRGADPLENFRIAVMGEVADGAWGIGHQMRRLDAHGLKGVFFVEALSSHLFGNDMLKRIVDPILTAGHEVQLHLHAEWLNWIDKDLVGSRRGINIADFSYPDQYRLLELGLEAMVAAGAPRPTAFRAGNYGADNNTLKALASLGLEFDSSYNRPYLGQVCRIETEPELSRPVRLDGVVEVPITFFEDYPGHTRALQLCAVSIPEFQTVLAQLLSQARSSLVIVSHSFELLNLRRTRANRMLLRRFDRLCALLQSRKAQLPTAGFRDCGDGALIGETVPGPLVSNPLRTAMRMLEQSFGDYFYGRA